MNKAIFILAPVAFLIGWWLDLGETTGVVLMVTGPALASVVLGYMILKRTLKKGA